MPSKSRKAAAYETSGLPADLTAERTILGAVLVGNEFGPVKRTLSVSDFDIEAHRLIYRAMEELHARGEGIDRLTVANELRARRQLQSVGGMTYLVSIDDGMPRNLHLDDYMKSVREKTVRRVIIRRAEKIRDEATDPACDVPGLITLAADTFGALSRNGTSADNSFDIDSLPPIHSYKARNIEFAVERLFAMGCITLLSGESGCGKSTLTTAAAAEVVRGGEFAGRLCTKRKVLILDRENGIEVVNERFERLRITEEGPRPLVWGGWLETEPPAVDAAIIREWVAKTEPKPLLTIDTAVTFLEGDENSATDVRKFMESIRRIANLGAGIVLLHHSGKAETAKDYRGSSYFKGGSDVALMMTNFGSAELGKVRLKAFKSRFTIDRDIVLDYHNGSFTSDTRAYAPLRTVTEQLTELLTANPKVTKTEFEKLAADHKLGRNQARTYLDNGVAVGEIEVTPGQKNTHYYSLRLQGGGVIQ
jgi:hypothetical protein